MITDFTLLYTEVRNAAERAFTEVRASHPDEHFYAFALYTDESAMTVMPAANTEEGFQRTDGPHSSEANYYRWASGEWAYEAVGEEAFSAACVLLQGDNRYEGQEEGDEAQFVAFRLQVLETMIASLADLDAQEFFGTGSVREQITLFVSISDSDDSEATENASAQRLNPASVYERFVQRYP